MATLLIACVLVCLPAHRYECSHCNKFCATERLLRDHMRQHGKMMMMMSHRILGLNVYYVHYIYMHLNF